MAISRGTSGGLLYDMQVDMHKVHFPGWKAELSLYNAITSGGFSAGGQRLKMDFAKWSPQQRKLVVDLTLQMKGGFTGYLGTATSKDLQTAAQGVQGKVVAYDFAGVAHSFQYDMILEKLNSEAGQAKSYVREILVQQMETFKHNGNLMMIGGYYGWLCDGATYDGSAQTIAIAPGNSVQNMFIGQLIQDTTAVSTSVASGAPVANYHGMISAIAEDGAGGYTITYTHYDGSTGCQFTSSATAVYLHGQYAVSPYGLKDFLTASNTVGDLARSGIYNPRVTIASNIQDFATRPAKGIVVEAAAIRRNTSNAIKVNCALMSEITGIWFQDKYADRLRVNQDQGISRVKDPNKRAFGYDPIFEISPTITAYQCDGIPDGEIWLIDTENIGFTQLPGEDGPNYVDMMGGGGEGIRIHGTLNKETALAWFYQLYARHLGGFGRIHSIPIYG